MALPRGTGWVHTTAPYRYWCDLGISANGNYMIAVANSTNGAAYRSTNGGVSWSTISSLPTDCVRCAVSPDGAYMTAWSPSQDRVYVSTDYGANFTLNSWTLFTYNLRALTIVGDGQRQYAGCNSFTGPTDTCYTTDAWTTYGVLSGQRYHYRVAASDDGTTVVRINAASPYAEISTDSGANWTTIEPTEGNPLLYGYDVAMSTDGTYITIASGRRGYTADYLYVSTDGGATWSANGPNLIWYSVTMSGDGQYQTAIGYYVDDYRFYTSSDYGDTWEIQTNPSGNQMVVRASATGGLIQIASQEFNEAGQSFISISAPGIVEIAETYAIPLPHESFEQFNLTQSISEVYSIPTPADVLAESPRVVSISESGNGIAGYAGDWLQAGMNGGERNPRFGKFWYKSPYVQPISSIKLCAVSSTGQYQVIAGSGTGYIYRSEDYGRSWAELTAAGSRAWSGLAMSSNGNYITGVAPSTNIMVSTDGGDTFTARGVSTKQWTCTSMSDSGQYQTAGASDSAGGLYYSSTSGTTWTLVSSLAQYSNIISTKVSPNGATSMSGNTSSLYMVYSTSNFGSWSTATSVGNPYYVGCTETGQYGLTAVGANYGNDTLGYLRTTANYGAGWSSNYSIFAALGVPALSSTYYFRCRGVAASSDGSRYVVLIPNSGLTTCTLYISFNKGLSWEKHDTLPFCPPFGTHFAYSADLNYMIIPDGT